MPPLLQLTQRWHIIGTTLALQGSVVYAQVFTLDSRLEINRESSYQELWTNRQLGQIIGRLGFEKEHTRQGNALVWNEGLIKKLESDPRYETAFKQIEMTDAYPTARSPSSHVHSQEPEEYPKDSKL